MSSRCARCGEPRAPDMPCGLCLFAREPPTTTIHHGTIELHEELGGGAMGTVFRGLQVQLGRDVAVKLVPPGTADANRRLLREAAAMARLQHPHILPLLDVGEEGDQAYLVMAYAPGGTLAAHVPLEEARVVELGVALADALAHAHQRGVIHCDIKPENVLLDAEGRPLLADFSIAHVTSATRTITHTRGTPYFIAPEVLAGRAPDARSDLFSLGVLLHFAWHGKLPAFGVAPAGRPLQRVIARAMDEDPARRPPDAVALRDELRALQQGKRVVRAPRRRWPILAALGGAAAVAVVVALMLRSSAPAPSLAGAWHMRSEPIAERGEGAFVVDVTRDKDAWVLDYHSGLMRCTFAGRRCAGTWYGRSGDGWFFLDLSADGTKFVGRWGYTTTTSVSAEIHGTRVRTDD